MLLWQWSGCSHHPAVMHWSPDGCWGPAAAGQEGEELQIHPCRAARCDGKTLLITPPTWASLFNPLLPPAWTTPNFPIP